MPDPPAPPTIPPKIRAKLIRRLRELAANLSDPTYTSGKDPVLVTQRWSHTDRLKALADQLETGTENIEHLGQAEIVALVLTCPDDDEAFKTEFLSYAHDFHYVARDHLSMKGLLSLFER